MATVLMTFNYIIEVDEEEIKEEFGALDKIQSRFEHNIIVKDRNNKRNIAEWERSSWERLSPDKMNCGKCSVCDCWVTDMEKPEPILGLEEGATVEGKLYCSEHLPPDHKYAF